MIAKKRLISYWRTTDAEQPLKLQYDEVVNARSGRRHQDIQTAVRQRQFVAHNRVVSISKGKPSPADLWRWRTGLARVSSNSWHFHADYVRDASSVEMEVNMQLKPIRTEADYAAARGCCAVFRP